eukprot:Gb_27878 [translate_table: standard]
MGGIGKTTLSKAVFNDIKSMFYACCFVSDVRDRANESTKGLKELQEQILKGLVDFKLKLNSVDEGKVKMREHLRSTRALLILDDVDDKKQLEALHGDQWFGGGSRVIITTRINISSILRPRMKYMKQRNWSTIKLLSCLVGTLSCGCVQTKVSNIC